MPTNRPRQVGWKEAMAVDEEVVLLEEQLATAHADVERLESRLAEAEALAATREAEVGELRRHMEASRRELAARDAALEEERQGRAGAEERARTAAQRYREAVLAREPDLPAELVSGASVEEIDESVTRARQTVAQVRQHLEQQALALRIPAGAPARTGPDLAGLSAAEKIRLGLQQT